MYHLQLNRWRVYAPERDQVIHYLEKTGWIYTRRRGGGWIRGGDWVTVRSFELANRGIKWQQYELGNCLRFLSGVEDRSVLDVYWDVMGQLERWDVAGRKRTIPTASEEGWEVLGQYQVSLREALRIAVELEDVTWIYMAVPGVPEKEKEV